MTSFIVITTINGKSEGISSHQDRAGWSIIVVGDKKSKSIRSEGNLRFLSIENQETLNFQIVTKCPYNHYTRKNIGYLLAMQNGAKFIYDTDDDNLPYENWKMPPFECDRSISTTAKFINTYRVFTDKLVWPRGFPLDELRKRQTINFEKTDTARIGIWQGLVDNDPDVDAIYRLIWDEKMVFEKGPPFRIPENQYTPINSQNTFWISDVFKYLYLPATVEFRFTDILRGYIAQRLMWSRGLSLGIHPPLVFQNRNEHDYYSDLKDELNCYVSIKDIVKMLDNIKIDDDRDDLYCVYEALFDMEIVKEEELDLVMMWLHDYNKIINGKH